METKIQYVEISDIPQQTTICKEDYFYENIYPKIEKPCYLFLDQSSSTGLGIFDNKSRLVCYGVITRDTKNENMMVYSVELQNKILELAEIFDIKYINYEEVYNQANMITTEQLFYLKNKIKELTVTHKELGLDISGLDASSWKSALAKGSMYKMPREREEQKKQTAKMVEEIYPLINYEDFKKDDDITDALGIGIAIMLKGDKKSPWKMTRYNKKLPIETIIVEEDITKDNIKEKVATMRKPFRDAYEIGGYFELELDRKRKIEDTIKKYLSHKDVLLAVHIPKEYKYWGYMLLMNNINPDNLKRTDEGFIYIACRKKRI